MQRRRIDLRRWGVAMTAAVILGMSTSACATSERADSRSEQADSRSEQTDSRSERADSPLDPGLAAACTPTVDLQMEDQGPGGRLVTEALAPDPVAAVQELGRQVCAVLYERAEEPPAATRLRLVIRDARGEVGWKAGQGSDITVMISTDHVRNVAAQGRDTRTEVRGILAHEMTHMFQHDDRDGGGVPIGLIEGIADYVRITLGLHPEARPDTGGTWDAGYTSTGFFLRWIEARRPGAVARLNASMSSTDGVAWTPRAFEDITGEPVERLWATYVADR